MQRTGQQIGEGGRYELQQELGRGAMGQVYLGLDARLQRRVVVKILADEYARNEGVRRRFVNEALIQANILHPHIVRALDAVEDGPLLAIVMDYVDGPDLDAYLRQRGGRLTWPAAVALLEPVLDAVSTAHASGIVHRDLKPANLLIEATPGGPVPKVADFGIAKILGGDPGAGKTRAGAVMGTPHYMPPEQLRGLTDLDARADVYALGAILYQMVTGSLPYGDRTTEYEVTHAVLSGDAPPPASQQNPTLPAGVDAFIARAMAGDRDQRFQTVAELRAALHMIGAAPGVAAPRTVLEEGPPAGPIATGHALPHDPVAASPRRGVPVLPLALGALVVLLVGGLVAFVAADGGASEAAGTSTVPDPRPTADVAPPPPPPPPVAPTCPPDLPEGPAAARFAESLWQPGNVWVYDTTRTSTKSILDEAAGLRYRLRREIQSVSPHAAGRLVRFGQSGGVVAEPSVTWLVSEDCVRDPETLETLFCLGSGQGLVDVEVAGTGVRGYRALSSAVDASVHPGVGLLEEAGPGNRKGTRRVRRLAAFRVGDCSVGDVATMPTTCDWSGKKTRGAAAGSAPGGSFGALIERHLSGRLKRFVLGVGGAHGVRELEAYTDSSTTVARLAGLSGAAGEGFVLDGGLQALKLRRRPDGSADDLALVTTDDAVANLHLLEVRAGEIVGAHQVRSPGSHRRSTIRGYVTAEGDDCVYLLAIRDPSGATRVARYGLHGSSLTPAGGSLPADVLPIGGLR